MDLAWLPAGLRAQMVMLAGDPAWPPAEARAVVGLMRERGVAVVGVELLMAETGGPRLLGWSEYRVEFAGDWGRYVNENADRALAELQKEVPGGAVFNLTWIESEADLAHNPFAHPE
jgi:hypothetical protein